MVFSIHVRRLDLLHFRLVLDQGWTLDGHSSDKVRQAHRFGQVEQSRVEPSFEYSISSVKEWSRKYVMTLKLVVTTFSPNFHVKRI